MGLLRWLLVAALADGLGPPVRHEGVAFRPPASFHMALLDALHGTRAASIGGQGFVVAAMLDGEGEDAASLTVSLVDGPFAVGSGSRDVWGAAVAQHFHDRLDQPLALDRVELAEGRVEVHGTIRAGGQARHVVAVAFDGPLRHPVVVASVPTGRWQALAPVLAASLSSFKFEPGAPAQPRALAGGLLAVTAALLALSIGLWRQRREKLTAPP